MAVEFTLPRGDEHTAVVGRNGSGKSQLGAWLLSVQDLKRDAWVVLDYKGEEIFNSLRNIREISFNEIPKEPGLYILRSQPNLDDATEAWLWRLWKAGDTGLFCDEGYMLPGGPQHKGAFQAILTQGRSLHIPVITLTQRPVRVTPFAFSEASHIAVFDLNRKRDWQTIEEATEDGFSEWFPDGFDNDGRLPPYHARWFSVKKRAAFILKPVPDADTIVDAIDRQLDVKRRWF